MSTKVLFKMMLPFGLLAVVFLATQIVSSKSTVAASEEETTVKQSIAGPDMIEKLAGSQKSNNLTYDDYFQRHASEYSAGLNYDDYFQRHASEYSAGSDYIGRNPSAVAITKPIAGSDWFERHR